VRDCASEARTLFFSQAQEIWGKEGHEKFLVGGQRSAS
jgi:hypothetical protein